MALPSGSRARSKRSHTHNASHSGLDLFCCTAPNEEVRLLGNRATPGCASQPPRAFAQTQPFFVLPAPGRAGSPATFFSNVIRMQPCKPSTKSPVRIDVIVNLLLQRFDATGQPIQVLLDRGFENSVVGADLPSIAFSRAMPLRTCSRSTRLRNWRTCRLGAVHNSAV